MACLRRVGGGMGVSDRDGDSWMVVMVFLVNLVQVVPKEVPRCRKWRQHSFREQAGKIYLNWEKVRGKTRRPLPAFPATPGIALLIMKIMEIKNTCGPNWSGYAKQCIILVSKLMAVVNCRKDKSDLTSISQPATINRLPATFLPQFHLNAQSSWESVALVGRFPP